MTAQSIKVKYEEDTYRKTAVLHFSALKPKALVASKATKGRYDFDKPDKITDLSRQSNKKEIEKIAPAGVIGSH